MTFIHQPDDFLPQFIEKMEQALLDLYRPAASAHGLAFEFVPSHELVPCVDSQPHLYHGEVDLLAQPGCFMLEQASFNSQADRFLRSIYEVVQSSDSVLLNRATTALECIERDKVAIANHAGQLGIRCIPSLVVPFGKYARMIVPQLGQLESSCWILKPRELSMGRAVIKIDRVDTLLSALDLVAQSAASYIVQPFIPNSGDLRLYMVDGDMVTAQWRRAADGGYIANTSRGGSSTVAEIPAEVVRQSRLICESLSARYLCVDWLVVEDGFVLNEWCTTLGGFKSLPQPQRSQMANAFFGYVAEEIERGNQRISRGRTQ